MTTKEFNDSLRTNCLGEYLDQDGDTAVFYIDFDEKDNSILVGTICNIGLLVDFTVSYDDDISFDENLQNIADAIYENGYTDLN